MTLRLLNESIGVPGGFRYKDPETGAWIRGPHWWELRRLVRVYRRANNLPIHPTLDADIQQQLCESIPPEYCVCDEMRQTPAPSVRLTFSGVVQFTRTMVSWFGGGRPKVDRDEAHRRAQICSSCPFNVTVDNCGPCLLRKLRESIADFVDGSSTPYDSQLNACSVCGCGLRAKVHFPLDILQKNISDTDNEKYPDWCWVKKKATV